MTNDLNKTERITIWGIVQGVGFRPFVSRLAKREKIKGNIKNMGGFVQLMITDTEQKIKDFITTIENEKPDASHIVRIKREPAQYVDFNTFSIEKSIVQNDEIGMIPADIAVCDSCLEEFYDPDNPRYKHPFISCTVCGPRYTIIDSLPYDRMNTTMNEFPMCEFCQEQYDDPNTKRFHSQTISCHDCGPMPEYIKKDGEQIIVDPGDRDKEKAVNEAVHDLKEGKVIALKGTGGYYFVASPFNDEAIGILRHIKIREEKPFAVMFKDMGSIRNYCIVNDEEEALLKSAKRPIVLLERKENSYNPRIVKDVCRSSRYIGAFLPSIGIQYQMLDETGPLVMTSANLSDLPIIYKDDEILDLLKTQDKLSGVLLNRRKIRMSLDDSVARVIDNTPQLTRRSKGYAPVPVFIEKPGDLNKNHQIFATGGQLKSAFALSKGNFSYMSQYFGDLDSMDSRGIYENNYYRMKKFFGIEPELVVSDLHPLYSTTQFAERITEDNKEIELLKVQHHHAHIASVMAEHGLDKPVIGVSFDGTGYGTDGNVWGGEFLICHEEEYDRYSHLKYVDMIGGDVMAKEGWKSAVAYRSAHPHFNEKKDENKRECLLDISEIIDYSIRENTLSDFNDIPTVEAAIKHGINIIKTSSMGRLFDAVASLLGIHHINRYEGECAIMLENAAHYAMITPGQNRAWDLALKFHEDAALLILNECLSIREDRSIYDVALSGGVFQNKILMERSLELLREHNFNIYYNEVVPTNDGGIALGQNLIGMYHLMNKR